ncbi:hypothetical protein CC77DRAFT_1100751 [Alternaria alternata]|uniref:Uncharacterized protein n=1 Tax=Alternaria alternata TaxID=5599 RepID=A0A177D2A4_ALTAL|nr:hypothetical protein CC77DRAFT_1100751 [Alternaria alternata]OAG13417.1 hypothetical protein CC77DRAFT_1100751 [Alternaria alternata]
MAAQEGGNECSDEDDEGEEDSLEEEEEEENDDDFSDADGSRPANIYLAERKQAKKD